MRPAEYTQEQVIEAGNQLLASGRPITGYALRKVVGGGMAVRLKQMWDEYNATQSVTTQEPVADLPVEVAERLGQLSEALVAQLHTLVVDINDRAIKSSERRVADVLRAAGEQREQAERELADAAQTVEDLEEQVDTLTVALAEQREQMNRVQNERQALAIELAQVKERLASVEEGAEAAQLAAAEREQGLQQQLAEQRRLEQMAREREAQAEGARMELEKQHLENAEVCQKLRGDLHDAQGELATAQATIAVQTAKLENSAQALADTRGELKEAKDEAKTAQRLAAEASGREQSAQAQVKALTEAAGKQKLPAKTSTTGKPKPEGKE